jgi:hypothetical protein
MEFKIFSGQFIFGLRRNIWMDKVSPEYLPNSVMDGIKTWNTLNT